MKWIKCSKRLPELDKEILISTYTCEEARVMASSLTDLNSYKRYMAKKKEKYPPDFVFIVPGFQIPVEEVTHWMPFPKPPKDNE